jgi:hypothetical protein
VSIQNITGGTPTRSYVAEFTITGGEANTDVVKSVTLTLDTAGTWTLDNAGGLLLQITLMSGSTYQTTANTWTAGNFLGTSAQFNFFGTLGNVFELFDVGLYEGTVAPTFVVPDYASELALCKRYFQKHGGDTLYDCTCVAYATGAGLANAGAFAIPEMRAVPTSTQVGSWGYANATALNMLMGRKTAMPQVLASAAGLCQAYPNNTSAYLTFNARL